MLVPFPLFVFLIFANCAFGDGLWIAFNPGTRRRQTALRTKQGSNGVVVMAPETEAGEVG